jgi:single-stranded DNA-binding protein
MFEVQLRGNIGQAPRLVTNKSGNSSYLFTVCERAGKDKQGRWVSVFLNEARGKKLAESLTVGTDLLLRGPLTSGLYTDKEGKTSVQLSLNVDTLEFLSSKPKTDAKGASPEADLQF